MAELLRLLSIKASYMYHGSQKPDFTVPTKEGNTN